MDELQREARGMHAHIDTHKNYMYDFMLFTFILLNDISKAHKSSSSTAAWPSPHPPPHFSFLSIHDQTGMRYINVQKH